MNLETKVKYLTCNKEGLHQGECLNFVCVEANCHSRGILCSVCRSENHSKHRVLPLRMFLSELLKSNSSFDSQRSSLFDRITEMNKDVIQGLTNTVERIAVIIRNFEEEITKAYDTVKRKLVEKIQLHNNIEIIVNKILKGDYQNHEDLNKEVLKIVNNTKQEKDTFSLSFDIEAICTEAENKKNTILAGIKNLLVAAQSLLSAPSIIEKSIIIGNASISKFTAFSPTNKSKSIVLNDNNREARQGENNTGRFIFFQQPLKVMNNHINKAAFKIKSTNWIGLGISMLDRIKDKKYAFQYSELGHGSYLLSNNGYTWSHSQKQDNVQEKGFKFKTGDIIQVQFSHPFTSLKFSLRGGKTTYEMKVAYKPEQLKNLYFCANLCSLGDTVEIVD